MAVVRAFVSRAGADKAFAVDFRERLKPHLDLRTGAIALWEFELDLYAGRSVDGQIQAELAQTAVGICLVSAPWKASWYAINRELKELVLAERIIIPVLLRPIDLELHDLGALNGQWIVTDQEDRSRKDGRSYIECSAENGERDRFVIRVVREIVRRLEEPREGRA